MKTEMEMVTAHVYLRSWVFNGRVEKPKLVFETEEQENGDSFVYKKICESQVAIPKLSEVEIEKLMAGAELDALYEAKERLQAETHRKMMGIDNRIGELLALENKGGDDETID